MGLASAGGACRPARSGLGLRLLRCLLTAAATIGLPSSVDALGFSKPNDYAEGAVVELKVNKLTSVSTQLPYPYYTLPYCRPTEIKDAAESMGEILEGDFIENSPYEIKMLQNRTCSVLCYKDLTKEDKHKFRSMIDDDYLINWIIDELPSVMNYRVRNMDGQNVEGYSNGFPVGYVRSGRYYIHNHVAIKLKYHRDPTEFQGYRVVGFEVKPSSIHQSTHKTADSPFEITCYGNMPVFDLGINEKIAYTYDVEWHASDIRWAHRWENYLKLTGAKIHWFSIFNSLMIMFFLTGLVAMIILRTLRADIVKYNELANVEEAAEETGWKLVHGDVFRRPKHSKMLCASVGVGAQVMAMTFVTLVAAVLGVIAPGNRGAMLQTTMVIFAIMGVLAGFVSSSLYKMFGGQEPTIVTLQTALVYPGIFFLVFFILNLLIWGQKSSGAVPVFTILALLFIWLGVSVPFVFLGAKMGNGRPRTEIPVRVNQIPREIPGQKWYIGPWFTCIVGGILPFGAIFTELFFFMSSLWQHQFYYLFGFVSLVIVILIVTCAEISIALTYLQLTSEDHRWWWRSFLSTASSSIYVFIYSMLYFSYRLHIDKLVPALVYFGYMFLISTLMFLLTGSIGTLASFWFVRTIYNEIKID